jgi:hypothetical protein
MRPGIVFAAGIVLSLGLPAFAFDLGIEGSAWPPRDVETLPGAVSSSSDVVLTGTPKRPSDRPPVVTPAPPVMPQFVPPPTDKPKVTLRSAASRTAGQTWPQVYALTPEHPGRTVFAQPSLFWYLDGPPPADVRTVFTLKTDARDAPVAELQIDTPTRAGIQRIRLADHGVTLGPDVDYEWSVALVVDSERWSRNPYAVGGIERVAAPQALESRLADAGPAGSPHVYAELGLWYDALGAVSDLIDAAPGDPIPAEMRDALLAQVGLEDIAEAR